MFVPTPRSRIQEEKQKARKLKHSSWWKNKLQQGKCHYCENTFDKKDLTMDHLVPLVRGGKSHKKNLVVACKKCNFEKKHKDLVELRLHK